jgi:alpha-N-arabinofuranosidase
VSLCNLHHEDEAELVVELRGMRAADVKGRVLTAKTMNTMNTFEHPRKVKPVKFHEYKLSRTKLKVSLPPRSVVMLEVNS